MARNAERNQLVYPLNLHEAICFDSAKQDGRKDLGSPSSPIRRSGGVRKKRADPSSPYAEDVSSPTPFPPTSPINYSASQLPPVPVAPIVPPKVFAAFNPDTLHQDILESIQPRLHNLVVL